MLQTQTRTLSVSCLPYSYPSPTALSPLTPLQRSPLLPLPSSALPSYPSPPALSKKPALKAGAPAPGGKKKKGEEEDLDSPLIKNDKKNQRFKDENSLKVLKWNFKVQNP